MGQSRNSNRILVGKSEVGWPTGPEILVGRRIKLP